MLYTDSNEDCYLMENLQTYSENKITYDLI